MLPIGPGVKVLILRVTLLGSGGTFKRWDLMEGLYVIGAMLLVGTVGF
jgi:hypothetical protein